jgi:spore coat protein U-like protein
MMANPWSAWRVAGLTLLGVFTAASARAGACTVSSSGLAFGNYQPLTFAGKLLSADKASDATISVVCTGISTGGSYSIALGPSLVGNSMNPRYMANGNGGPHMVFNVYRDATYSTIWGDGITGAMLAGTLPLGDSSQTHTVFGKIPAAQNTLRPGSFSGVLGVSLTYNP